jgi:hypothetical protein
LKYPSQETKEKKKEKMKKRAEINKLGIKHAMENQQNKI